MTLFIESAGNLKLGQPVRIRKIAQSAVESSKKDRKDIDALVGHFTTANNAFMKLQEGRKILYDKN